MSAHETISALTYALIRDACPAHAEAGEFPQNRVSNFIEGQVSRMPDHLRLPMRVLLWAFDWSALPSTGSRFHRLPHSRRKSRIEAWKSGMGVQRDFVKFYENLAIFGWHVERYERGRA